jgi:hypothetical protein
MFHESHFSKELSLFQCSTNHGKKEMFPYGTTFRKVDLADLMDLQDLTSLILPIV